MQVSIGLSLRFYCQSPPSFFHSILNYQTSLRFNSVYPVVVIDPHHIPLRERHHAAPPGSR